MEIRRCVNCMEETTEEVCPYCGYHASQVEQASYGLKRNTILHGRYLVGNMLGQGGFGITYIGFDMMLNIKVAIKEYYPMGYVSRDCTQSNRIMWGTTKYGQTAPQRGCEEFLKEARRMAQIDVLPEIVRVRDTFMDNNTAYIVMDYVQGQTLKSFLLQNGVMGFAECVGMLLPLMRSLAEVHKRGIIHRDISPDNIMVEADGKLRLLDLGSAKELNLNDSGNSQLVTKKGFSPVEQCLEGGRVGTWTDVYALCATIYYCITGKLAPDSLERMAFGKDHLSFDEQMKEPLGEKAKNVLRRGLAVKSEDRIQTVEELIHGLEKAADEKKPDIKDIVGKIIKKMKKIFKRIIIGCVVVFVVLYVIGRVAGNSSGEDQNDSVQPNSQDDTDTSEDVTDPTPKPEPDTVASEENVDHTQNVLMQEEFVQEEDENKWVLGKEGLSRSSIVSVNFLDSLKDKPNDAWDVSKEKNGNVMAWTEPADDGLYHLFIAGNGGVMAYDCSSQFAYYDNVREVWFNECFYTEQLSSTYAMFYKCEKLERLIALEHLDTSNVENMGFMFCGCSSLEQLNLSGFQTDKVTNMESMFNACTSLKAIDVSGFDTVNVEKMNAMFYQCSSLEALDISSFDTGNVTTMKYMLADCRSLDSLKMQRLNNAKVEDMQYMFANCTKLGDLRIIFNTSRVTNMQGMFSGCSALRKLDLSDIVTSNVTNMSFMFDNCGALRELIIGDNFNTGNVTTMCAMFQMCSSLPDLNLSSFNTQNVTDMSYMFYGCSNLKELDLSGFDMSQVTNRDNMLTNVQITEEEAGLR